MCRKVPGLRELQEMGYGVFDYIIEDGKYIALTPHGRMVAIVHNDSYSGNWLWSPGPEGGDEGWVDDPTRMYCPALVKWLLRMPPVSAGQLRSATMQRWLEEGAAIIATICPTMLGPSVDGVSYQRLQAESLGLAFLPEGQEFTIELNDGIEMIMPICTLKTYKA